MRSLPQRTMPQDHSGMRGPQLIVCGHFLISHRSWLGQEDRSFSKVVT
jgi:hypothetical protein